MVLDKSNSRGLEAKTGRAAHGRRGRSRTAGTARPTPPPLVAAEGCVLQKGASPEAFSYKLPLRRLPRGIFYSRICPSPSTMNFVVVKSSTPMGP